jgi:hypothetical protein
MKPRKMKRGIYATDEAFLSFQAMAEDVGQAPGAFFEMLMRELAKERLSEEKRAEIKRKAEQLAARTASGE